MGNNHEGGDFKLENKIKQIKALTPKGKKDCEMWKRIIRCSKDVWKVVRNGRQMLGLDAEDGTRQDNNIPMIIKWRAYLRHSKYLKVIIFVSLYQTMVPLNMLSHHINTNNKIACLTIKILSPVKYKEVHLFH